MVFTQKMKENSILVQAEYNLGKQITSKDQLCRGRKHVSILLNGMQNGWVQVLWKAV